MQRDAPYLDVNKHNEAHTYYNVPPGVSADNERCLVPTVSQQPIHLMKGGGQGSATPGGYS